MTEAGVVLLGHAEAIGPRLAAAQADLAALAEGAAGTLRLGAFQSAAARCCRSLLPASRPTGPTSTCSSPSPRPARLLAMVEGGRLDLAFTALPVPDGPFAAAGAARGSVRAARRPHHLVAGLRAHGASLRGCRSSVSVTAAQAWPASASGARARAGRRRPLGRQRHDHQPRDVGVGAALVPRMLADLALADRRLAVLEPEPALPARRVGIAWHRDRELAPAARAFVDLTIELCRAVTPQAGSRRPPFPTSDDDDGGASPPTRPAVTPSASSWPAPGVWPGVAVVMAGDATRANDADHGAFALFFGAMAPAREGPCCIANRLAAARVEQPILR